MSDYYNATGYPSNSASGDSASARSEFSAISAAFTKLPTLTGNALKIVRINATALGLEASSLNAAKILSTDGTSTVIANIPMSTYKLTGLGAGTTNGDSVRFEQLNAGEVVNTPAGSIAATSVQAAINELDTEKVHRTSTTGSAILPSGTTGQRDVAPAAGYTRFNSSYAKPEVYNGTSWSGLGGAEGSSGDAIFYLNGQTVTADYSIPSGQNAHSIGPITVNGGVIVTVPAGSYWVIG